MPTLGKQTVSIFVDRLRQEWIVRDPEGDFWRVPPVDNAWDNRSPADPATEEMDLEPVPGHYKYMLQLPF